MVHLTAGFGQKEPLCVPGVRHKAAECDTADPDSCLSKHLDKESVEKPSGNKPATTPGRPSCFY